MNRCDMLQVQEDRSHSQSLQESFKQLGISFEGWKGITEESPKETSEKKDKCDLVGNSNILKIKVGGKDCEALIDTGSMITTVGEDFYQKELHHIEVKDLAGDCWRLRVLVGKVCHI